MGAALDAGVAAAAASTAPGAVASEPANAAGATDAAATQRAPVVAPPAPGTAVAVPPAPVPAEAASATAVPASAPASTTAAAATTTTQKPASGVSFPVRAATSASTQASPNAVGHASAADAGSIGGALFSLVLVVGLILALGWLAKRMPGLQRGAGNAQLKVVASVALGPRDRAVVVDVGGTQLLLGVGQGGVRALHTLDRPLTVAEASNVPSPFAQILAQHFGKKP